MNLFPPRLLSRFALLLLIVGAVTTLAFDHPIVDRFGYYWLGGGSGILFTMFVLFKRTR